jgi:truncated hemoglobin YjbI
MLRLLARTYATRPVPKPTAAIPSVEAFLTKIGRNCNEHAQHFPAWHTLFNTSSAKMKELGIDVSQRRYILSQLEKVRQGLPVTHHKLGKKSFFGGERNRNERVGKLRAQQRQERYDIEDANK